MGDPQGVPLQLTAAETSRLREQTPGTKHRCHLNHAGASLPSLRTLDVQKKYLDIESTIGGYEAYEQEQTRVAAVKVELATLLRAQPNEIVRTEHATAAWNGGFWSVPMKTGQRILTAEAAYGANAVAFIRAQERHGVTTEVVPSDETGQVDLEALEATLSDDVALIAVTHVPSNGGLVNPATDIGQLARESGAMFLLDACQSVGQLDLDVSTLGCDMLSGTGRKYLRGPRGTGFLWVSSRVADRLRPDHPDHHSATWQSPDHYEFAPGAQRFEHWEFNHAAWLGFGEAVKQATEIGTDRIEATVSARAEQLRNEVRSLGFAVHDLGQRRCGIVTVSHPRSAEDERFGAFALKKALAAEQINTSVATPASTVWDARRRRLPDLLRLSVHYLTTDEEIEQCRDALRTLV